MKLLKNTMTSVAALFNNVESFMAYLKEHGLKVQNYSGLYIVKAQDQSDVELLQKEDLKGLIYKVVEDQARAEVVCTGVKVPLEELPIDATPCKVQRAHDGVTFRLYHTDDGLGVSTNGMIYPNRGWGPRGCRTFIDMYADVSCQVDEEQLNPDWCYYATMEHMDHTNICKHTENKLILTRICDRTTLRDVPLSEAKGFKHVVQEWTGLDEMQSEIKRVQSSECKKEPVCDVGLLVYLQDGTVRLETASYKRAAQIKPNLADPRQHWTHLVQGRSSELGNMEDLWNELGTRCEEYLLYFPWHRDTFGEMTSLFSDLVQDLYDDYLEVYTHGFKSVHLPARHVNYQRALAKDFYDTVDICTLAWHLLEQDSKRIYYLMNPDNIPPKRRDDPSSDTDTKPDAMHTTVDTKAGTMCV